MSICFLFPGQSLAAHLRRRGCPILTVPPPLPSLRHPRPRRGRKEPTIKGRATEFHEDGKRELDTRELESCFTKGKLIEFEWSEIEGIWNSKIPGWVFNRQPNPIQRRASVTSASSLTSVMSFRTDAAYFFSILFLFGFTDLLIFYFVLFSLFLYIVYASCCLKHLSFIGIHFTIFTVCIVVTDSTNACHRLLRGVQSSSFKGPHSMCSPGPKFTHIQWG